MWGWGLHYGTELASVVNKLVFKKWYSQGSMFPTAENICTSHMIIF